MKSRSFAITMLILVCGSAVAAQETYRPPVRQDQPVAREHAVRTAGLTPSEWAIGAGVVSASARGRMQVGKA